MDQYTLQNGASAAEVKRRPQVQDESERVAKAIQFLSETVGALEDRLEIVMRPQGPEPVPPKTQEVEYRVPLAEQMWNHASAIDAIARRVQGIKSRLEV